MKDRPETGEGSEHGGNAGEHAGERGEEIPFAGLFVWQGVLSSGGGYLRCWEFHTSYCSRRLVMRSQG